MQEAVIVLVSALVAFVAGVVLSKSVMGSALAIVAQAHAAVSGGAKDVQELGARVSALEKRVADAVKAEVAKV